VVVARAPAPLHHPLERSTNQRVCTGMNPPRPEGCFQPPSAVVPGPLGRGLAVATRTGEDGVTVFTALLDYPLGRLHGSVRRERPAASRRYQRRVGVCDPGFFCGRQGLCPARPAYCI